MMRIADIDLTRDVMIVAEIGNNHEGSAALAEELIGLAAEAGADAVKFQTIVPERLVAGGDANRLAQLRRLCLGYEDFERLRAVADRHGVMFLSTPFDIPSVSFLDPLVPAFKIASGDNNFYPLLDAVAETAKPVILSTGLLDLEGVRRSRAILRDAWQARGRTGELVLLHCVSMYPTAIEDANLLAISTLAELGEVVGYSDHTLGLEAAVLSVALGARVIEKHFTIDHDYSDFRDHKLSVDPKQLAELVERVRVANTLLGTGDKAPSAAEVEGGVVARRSIVAAVDLPAGHVIEAADLTWLRPGGGLPAGEEKVLIGRRLAAPIRSGEPIRPDQLAPVAAP
jgi:N,N'-diacetyllegionaminate synthase